VPAAVGLLNRRKFEAVMVDLQLGEQSGLILDEVHLSSSNRTAVTFGIGDTDVAATSAFRQKSQFIFERPLTTESIHKTLRPAYSLILKERRSISVTQSLFRSSSRGKVSEKSGATA
jgi:FixJ family two-component response regulator